MKYQTSRRSVLFFAASTTAAAAMGAPPPARAGGATGTVTYENGAAIPKGRLIVSVDDPAAAKTARAAAAEPVPTDGTQTSVTLAIPAAQASATAEIVVRLERADGWLLARGSAAYQPDVPVQITLYTVMY